MIDSKLIVFLYISKKRNNVGQIHGALTYTYIYT